ncbi:MAG: type II secretion system F family protein [Arachnia sp.]
MISSAAAAALAAAAAWLLIGGAAASLGRASARGPSRLSGLAWLPAVLRPRRAGTASRALTRELPEALDLLAACLEAGLPTRAALDAVARASPQETKTLLQRVAAQLRLGRAGGLAWRELADHEVWGAVAGDLARAERSGLAVADTLRAHAEDARAAAREAAVTTARTVGVRSVMPLMCCFLPAFVLVGVVPIVASLLADFLG